MLSAHSFNRITPIMGLGMIGVMSVSILLGAYFFQFVLEIAPCSLCYQQRYPYYAVILITGCSYFSSDKIRWYIFALLAMIFLFSAGLAGYHAGVEWGFWQGPATCSGIQPIPDNVEDLLASLEQPFSPSCSDSSWRFLGLSLAGWNALASCALFIFSLLLQKITSRFKNKI